MKYCSLLLLLFSCTGPHHSGNDSNAAKILHIHSTHTSFPDSARANGHLYDSVLYNAVLHYSDNSVLIIVPPKLVPAEKVDLIFWFHGWRNNIDSADKYFELSKQFIASHRNAIFVLAETAKNSPDSYGGKLEQPGEFELLINDILSELKQEKVITQNVTEGNITLAGHSGAYRLIAYLLQNAGRSVHKVLLFDALYGQVDKFMNWIQEDPKNKFVHWYTNKGGGTDVVSIEMMKQLQQENILFAHTEETTLTADQLKNSRIIFVHSLREHNDIIKKPDNFQTLLKALK